jgi:putative ABC transport system permease protein
MPAIIVLTGGLTAIVAAAWVGATRPELRAIAVRNLRRRPGRALLVATGVLLATATLTSAALVGDSLRSSIRRSAFTQLGPVDEAVTANGSATAATITSALHGAHVDGVDGLLPIVSLTTTVEGRDFVPTVTQAQVIEVDFAAAAHFGGDPAATGISGSTPSGSAAVMNADLAATLKLVVGHRVIVYGYGTSRTFRVSQVLPRLGLAGLESRTTSVGSASPDLFVPPGTLDAMRREGRAVGAPAPTAVVLVSNRGGVLTSRRASDTVTAALRQATRGLPVDVTPLKQLLLDGAEAQSSQFGSIFRVFGIFSALGGLLLLVLTFGALARERARSLGILRAIGLSRRDMIATLVLEALLYCIVGVVLGAAVGIGIAVLVVAVAKSVLSNAASGGIELAFAMRTASVLVAVAIGLIVALGALAVTAAIVARNEVVALIRGDAVSRRGVDRVRLRAVGAGLSGLGAVVVAVGLIATNTTAAVGGAAVLVVGATIAAPAARRELVGAIGAAVALAWSVFEVRVGHRVFSSPALGELLTVSAVMSFAAAALVNVAHRVIARRDTKVGRQRTAPAALGFAYSNATPARTATISAMYAVVVFTLSLVVTVAHLYSGNVATVARDLGGGTDLEVTSNPAQPVDAHDVIALPGVDHVASASALDAHLTAAGSASTNDVALIGVSAALVGHGTPQVAVTAPDLRGRDLYQLVASDPSLVVVGADLRTTPQNTLDHHPPHVGDTLLIEDPTTGIIGKVRIAGLVADARYAGVDHVYGSDALIRGIHSGAVPQNVLFVETEPGTDNDVLAAIIDGTHVGNGAYARSFHRLANDRLSAQQQFLNILAGYSALGLLAGAAALAVAMIDRVRERTRQLAMLRALGCRRTTLRRALRVEASIIGLEGTIAGVGAAALLSWRLATTGSLGAALDFDLPYVVLVVIVVIALLSALAATTVAARRAARLQPATALRAEE